MKQPFIIKGASIYDLEKFHGEFKDLFSSFGVLIFPGIFSKTEILHQYIDEIRILFNKILDRQHIEHPRPSDLGALLTILDKKKSVDGTIITDLGSQNNKLLSFNKLKYSDFVCGALNGIFGEGSIIGTPAAGDTLHFFGPGEKYYPYNLPIHQDYQYLMQSPDQVTCYLGLSKYYENVGGLEVWTGSHKLGLLSCVKNKFGSFEVSDAVSKLRNYQTEKIAWNTGDFGLFHSLLCHRSIPNKTAGSSRIVQIFRFSNLNNPIAESYNWYSTAYNNRRGVDFIDKHPDLWDG